MPFTSGAAVGPHAEDSLWFAAMSFTLVALLLFAWMAVAWALQLSYRPMWPIKALRFMLIFGQHAFFIPLVANFASPFNCAAGAAWGSTTYACYGQGHLGE